MNIIRNSKKEANISINSATSKNFDNCLKVFCYYLWGVLKMVKKKKAEDWISLAVVMVLLSLALTVIYWGYIGMNIITVPLILILWIVIVLYILRNAFLE